MYGEGHICQRCYNKDMRTEKKRKREEEEEALGLLAAAAAAAPDASTPCRTQSAPLLLSPEQRTTTRRVLKSASIGAQGRSWSEAQRASLVRAVDIFQVEAGLSANKAVQAVAAFAIASPSRVRHVTQKFLQTGDLTPTAKKPKLTRSDPRHPLYLSTGPSLAVQRVLFQEVKASTDNKTHVTLDRLRRKIQEGTEAAVPRSTLHSWMGPLGLKYGERKFSGLDAAYADARIRQFLIEYARAVKEEEAGTAILVWMDESFIYAVGTSIAQTPSPRTA